MPADILIISFFIGFVWLTLLSFFFYRMYAHYNGLIRGATERSLTTILESILKDTTMTKKDVEKLQLRCDTIEKEGRLHIQKIGVLRFNPFKDTGGDQSFIISLIDGNNTGVILSSLYSRSGTRWYAKKVKKGLGDPHPLSNEEEKAIKIAESI